MIRTFLPPTSVLSFFFALICGVSPSSAQNTSSLVYPGPNGNLVYAGYANEGQTSTGNRMIDFSRAGYLGGGAAIPWVPVEVALDPLPGNSDDHARIQQAIDTVSALPLSPAGFRGTVLLRAGQYHVSQSLRIEADGVVIRGEGQHTGGTVVTFTATVKDDLFEFFGSGGWRKISGSETPIADTRVPSGVRSFDVNSAAGFSVGDRLMVHRTPNQTWINMLAMGRYGWTPSGYRSETPRVITAIDGNTITVDSPLVHAIESRYGGGEVYRYHFNGALRNVGIENIRLESTFTSNTDEDHGWSAVMFRRVENGWARRVTARHFGYSCIGVYSESQFVTVEDCAQLDPKSIVTGGRRYSFLIDDSSFILFQRCYTRQGRHDYVTQSKTAGPNVFVDSLAENTRSDIGPHQRYSEGVLFDNIRGGQINVQNRRSSGSGHGWAGAQTVFWNSRANSFICDAPKAAMNFSIGSIGSQRQGLWRPNEPDGIWESRGVPVTPRSLYYTQLADRLGHAAVATVTTPAQQTGTIWNDLSAWKGNDVAPGLPGFAPLGVDAGGDIAGTAVVHPLHAAIRYPLPGNFPLTIHGWTQLSGPANAIFDDASGPSTSVTFPEPGVYELQFSASQEDDRDPGNIITYNDSDTLTVTVDTPPPPPDFIANRSAVDRILGRSQDQTANPTGYFTQSSNRTTGATGSNGQRTDSNVVYRYVLPTLGVGETISAFSITFQIDALRDHSDTDDELHVYLLNSADPTTTGTNLYYHGPGDSSHAFVGSHFVASGGNTGSINLSPPVEVTFTINSGEALALLQSFYTDHVPNRAEAAFRFNLSRMTSDIGGSSLNRYILDNDPVVSSFDLFTESTGNTFANWIDGFGLNPEQQGFTDNPDGDGIPNGIEAWLGSHPGEFSFGITNLSTTDSSTTFTHPKSDNPPSELTGSYEWSPNLVDWYAGDGTDGPLGGPTVMFSAETIEQTAHVTATPSMDMDSMFIRIAVEAQ